VSLGLRTCPIRSPSPEPKFRVTSSEINYWIGKPVYSDDHKKIGEITDLRRDPDNGVTELFYRSGGFLGLRSKHYEITAGQIQQVQGDRVVLTLNKSEAEGLPETQDRR
jgi:sporulation protein YlmC with PRC-barrel domain